jgi:hypothetical protein
LLWLLFDKGIGTPNRAAALGDFEFTTRGFRQEKRLEAG